MYIYVFSAFLPFQAHFTGAAHQGKPTVTPKTTVAQNEPSPGITMWAKKRFMRGT